MVSHSTFLVLNSIDYDMSKGRVFLTNRTRVLWSGARGVMQAKTISTFRTCGEKSVHRVCPRPMQQPVWGVTKPSFGIRIHQVTTRVGWQLHRGLHVIFFQAHWVSPGLTGGEKFKPASLSIYVCTDLDFSKHIGRIQYLILVQLRLVDLVDYSWLIKVIHKLEYVPKEMGTISQVELDSEFFLIICFVFLINKISLSSRSAIRYPIFSYSQFQRAI